MFLIVLWGMIDLISHKLAREYYRISDYPFFVEFCLGSFAIRHLMTKLLPAVVEQLLEDVIGRIGAVVNRRKIAARKVLKKHGLTRICF
ncbi:hypothetical protein [Pedobacter sp.]|uniref:hypothetical protein n=1 Tax=Pedobacter sp. TaxID=1411316 RepID=UPI003BADAED2